MFEIFFFLFLSLQIVLVAAFLVILLKEKWSVEGSFYSQFVYWEYDSSRCREFGVSNKVS